MRARETLPAHANFGRRAEKANKSNTITLNYEPPNMLPVSKLTPIH
jgi:hypothetical protein